MTLPAFREFVVNAKQSRVLAFLSSYLVGGMEGHYYPSLYKPDCVDVDATVKSALDNRDIVKGFKAHAELGGFARWGTEVLRKASEIAKRADLPLYIHFGQMWGLPESGANGVDPDTILEQVVPLLKPGDIIAHPFTRHPGGFVNRQGKVHPIVKEALAVGLKTDVGTARTSASAWRASHSTRGSCPTRSAPTCTATTRACRNRAGRRMRIRTRNTCSSAARASRWCPR
jgi:dihydroorotase